MTPTTTPMAKIKAPTMIAVPMEAPLLPAEGVDPPTLIFSLSAGTRRWDRRGVGNYLTRMAVSKQPYC